MNNTKFHSNGTFQNISGVDMIVTTLPRWGWVGGGGGGLFSQEAVMTE